MDHLRPRTERALRQPVERRDYPGSGRNTALQTTTAELLYTPESEQLRFLPECSRVLRNYSLDQPQLAWVCIQNAVDSREGSINLLDLATRRNRSFPLPGRPGFFAETDLPGVLLIGLERRLVLFDLATAKVQETGITCTHDEEVIINDGVAVPNGLIFGTKHLKFSKPIAGLFHYDSQTRQLTELIGGQVCSNGKFVFPEGDHCVLIDIDSGPRRITRYVTTPRLNSVVSQSLVAKPEKLPAIPDGLRPTPDGKSVVVAFYNPDPVSDGIAQEIRLSDGEPVHQWTFPGSPRVTCPEIALIDGAVKIIFTTATEGMPEEIRRNAPQAGCLFIADSPYSAVPEQPPFFPAASVSR